MKEFQKSIIVDSSFMLALIFPSDSGHELCRDALKSLPTTTKFASSEACLAEVSWLLPNDKRLRKAFGEMLKLLDVQLVPLDLSSLYRVFELQDKYADLRMDFADATLVVASEKLEIKQILTLDRRDFSIYQPKHVKRLEIFP
ncbi:MAG: PIN domain-containing protein [Candidatus Obscuribacterales bacterium]|nr:PIN domain-containing protein [Candidatus Obscuribacterales bacterium]